MFTLLDISRLAALLDFIEILNERHFPMGHSLPIGLLQSPVFQDRVRRPPRRPDSPEDRGSTCTPSTGQRSRMALANSNHEHARDPVVW
jgi:hypothetical protein